MKKQSIRERVMSAKDIREERVDVPEWGFSDTEALTVRGLSGTARDEFEESCLRRNKNGADFDSRNLRAKLVARCVVDEDGDRVFSDADLEWLGGKSASALSRIYEVAAKLSRIGPEDLEELSKNSKSVPVDGSGSGSLSLLVEP